MSTFRRRLMVASIINSFVQQPRNQIWYTSTDGNVVTPYSPDVFGANILSNTYSDGKGILLFDGDVTTIGEMAFLGCDNLTSITIPDSVISIGYIAFSICNSLTSITIPDSVTTIGREAFGNCKGLISVTIGNSVTTIGDIAFYNCTSLTSVYCKAITPPTLLGSYVFDNNGSLRKIYIPTGSLREYRMATYWSEYARDLVGKSLTDMK